jgi:hypothetical protein
MQNCQIKIEGYYYNIFIKHKKNKSEKDKIHVVVWDGMNPIDNFDMCKFDAKEWSAWTCNTSSQFKIDLRLKLEKHLNLSLKSY